MSGRGGKGRGGQRSAGGGGRGQPEGRGRGGPQQRPAAVVQTPQPPLQAFQPAPPPTIGAWGRRPDEVKPAPAPAVSAWGRRSEEKLQPAPPPGVPARGARPEGAAKIGGGDVPPEQAQPQAQLPTEPKPNVKQVKVSKSQELQPPVAPPQPPEKIKPVPAGSADESEGKAIVSRLSLYSNKEIAKRLRTSSEKRIYEEQFPKKPPPYGAVGRKIPLFVNQFRVKLKIDNFTVRSYDVVIEPKVTHEGAGAAPDQKNKSTGEKKLPKRLLRQVWFEYDKQFRRQLGSIPAYDGGKIVYAMEPGLRQLAPKDVTIIEEGDCRERTFVVTLKPTGVVNVVDVIKYAKGQTSDFPTDTIQALEVSLRYFPSMRYWPAGRSLYNPDVSYDLGGGKNAHFGFFMSLRPGEKPQEGWLMTLTVNKSATGFIKPGNVANMAAEICNVRDAFEIPRRFRSVNQIRDKLKTELVGIKVKTTHNPSVPRKYSVIDITRKKMREITFTMEENGRTRSVALIDYYRNTYGVELRHLDLPCLQVGKKEKNTYLPMEVCEIIAGQSKLGRLSQQQTASLIRKTAIPAYERKVEIEKQIVGLVREADPMLKLMGMEVETKMPQIVGRVLPAPAIAFDGNQDVHPDNGKWDMRSKKFFKGSKALNWGIISFISSEVPRAVLLEFVRRIRDHAKLLGIQLGEIQYFEPIDVPRKMSAPPLRDQISGLDLLMVILPGREDFYGEIKCIAETEIGLMTQCIQPKHLGGGGGGGRGGRGGGRGGGSAGGAPGPSAQYIANVLLKINTKLGGTNSIPRLDDFTRRFLRNEVTLIIGADVTHPPPGSNERPSIAAIVGSIDVDGVRYTADIRVQGSRVEFIGDMKAVMMSRLRAFRDATGQIPRRILFFRDGVGEGMFREVRSYEIAKIQEACTELNASYNPKITFVVVQKRHHTRLFPADRQDACGRSGNVPAGTVVDKYITSPWFFDFYLVSHEGIQGTSKPTHYCVLWDDNQFSQDGLQAVAYYLCHCYVRCTRSVSIPAPTYYAHHVAARANEYMMNMWETEMSTNSGSSDSSVEADFPRLAERIRLKSGLAGKMFFV